VKGGVFFRKVKKCEEKGIPWLKVSCRSSEERAKVGGVTIFFPNGSLAEVVNLKAGRVEKRCDRRGGWGGAYLRTRIGAARLVKS